MLTTTVAEEIRGKLLSKEDIMLWGQQKWAEFFNFMDLAYDDGKYTVSIDKAKVFEQYLLSSDMVEEMLVRVNQSTEDDNFNIRSFFMRLTIQIRTARQFLKKFPSSLSKELVLANIEKPHCAFLSEIYDSHGLPLKEDKEKKSLTIVEMAQIETNNQSATDTSAQQLAIAIDKVSKIYNAIADAITEKDIKSMSGKDKINALKALSYLHGTQKKTSKKVARFLQKDPSKTDKQGLEEMMIGLSGASEGDEDEE